jgi:hypothetical protein
MADYDIRALTPETWPAYAALIEKHHGIFGGCWDTYFHSLERDPERTYDSNRALKCRLVEEGRAHAAVVFDGGAAVGWCQYGSPEELPNIHHRMEYLTNAERLPDYRVTASWSSAAFAVSRTRPAGTRSPLMMRDCWRCVRRSAIVGRRWRQRTGG